MAQAGLVVENSKGECNDGQHEINFRYGPALRIADEHAIYKTGAKEIAAQEGMAITFMAKYDEREGSSCHIHMSSAGLDDAGFERFVAGQLACLRELTLLYAPNINSYKRFARGVVRADRGRLGQRQPHLRGARRRPRRLAAASSCACPGADVNPYLALAAMIASGAARARARAGARAAAGGQRLRGRQAARAAHAAPRRASCSARATVAREAFGEEVVEHYLNNARVELEAFESFVTDWERVRGFERL